MNLELRLRKYRIWKLRFKGNSAFELSAFSFELNLTQEGG